MTADSPCLVIFCKRPAPGHGKQRLAATIGKAQAHIFAKAMLDCALEDARDWPGDVILSPAADSDTDWASGLLDGHAQTMAQPQGGLGLRLWEIDRKLRLQGYGNIIFMGTDSPLLLPRHFEQARAALEGSDIILSPASDGGVTLMGSRAGWPDMQHLPWSTDRLGQALKKLCCDQGLKVKNISSSYDIDVEDDLARLHRDLSTDTRPARRRLYAHLGSFLKSSEVKYA